jgi:hypothetical protein
MKRLILRGWPGHGQPDRVGRFYYKGFGLQNGLSVEIDDPVLMGAASTFVATKGADDEEGSAHSGWPV